MKNKLIVIGYLGIKKAYLNISREDAIKRYTDQEGLDMEYESRLIDEVQEFEFNDEFGVYDAWS